MKYRIVEKDGKYWVHAQIMGYFGLRWEKIGKHLDGYGLYPPNDFYNPLSSEKECHEYIKDFDMWYNNKPTKYNIKYKEVELKNGEVCENI